MLLLPATVIVAECGPTASPVMGLTVNALALLPLPAILDTGDPVISKSAELDVTVRDPVAPVPVLLIPTVNADGAVG